MKVRQILMPGFALLAMIVITACAGTPTPTSTPGSISATETPTSTVVIEATSSATAAPHELPTPLPKPVPSPIAVAFVNADHNIYIWGEGDPAFSQITTSGDAMTAVISSDGSMVAYSRSTDGSAYSLDVISSDGSNQRTLFTHGDFLGIPRPDLAIDSVPALFAWESNSHKLTMTTSYTFQGPGLVIAPDLIQFDADNGTHRTLLRETGDYQFAYSPDGSKLAISLPDGIDLFDSEGNQLLGSKFYTFPNVNTATEAAFLPTITWSRDSESFAFMVPPSEPFFGAETLTRVVKINSTDGSSTILLSAPMAFPMLQQLSPDLSAVAYLVSTSTTTSSFDLHFANLTDGTDEVVTTGTIVSDFQWSPDGAHFLFTTVSGSDLHANIGEVGGHTSQITEITSARGFAWLDVNRYLILDQTATGWKVWLGNINGAPTVLYTDTLTSVIGPSLSINR